MELVPTVTITNMHHRYDSSLKFMPHYDILASTTYYYILCMFRLPTETLRSFSGTSVCVLLDMQDVEAAADTSKDLFEEVCDRCVLTCRQILQDALTGGCTTVVLACSGVMKEVLGDIQVSKYGMMLLFVWTLVCVCKKISPTRSVIDIFCIFAQAMAMDVGVVLIEYPLSSFLSSKLMNKSLLSAQAAAKHVLARVEKGDIIFIYIPCMEYSP